MDALMRAVLSQFEHYINLSKKVDAGDARRRIRYRGAGPAGRRHLQPSVAENQGQTGDSGDGGRPANGWRSCWTS